MSGTERELPAVVGVVYSPPLLMGNAFLQWLPQQVAVLPPMSPRMPTTIGHGASTAAFVLPFLFAAPSSACAGHGPTLLIAVQQRESLPAMWPRVQTASSEE